MESQHQKWVNLSYLALSLVVGYLVFALSAKVVGTYDLEARVANVELIIRGISVVAAGLLFLILWRSDRSNQYMNEVVVELSRVTWPTQKETTSATFLVLIMVLISGLVLGLLDYIWTAVIKLII